MKNGDSLAVVIPAYKAAYFRDTLETLAKQTCKDFKVYVGDDCSPEGLEAIANEFVEVLDLHYQRFSENLGGTDLVAQWNRCVDLASEEWVWFFSDDDLADPNCVEEFFRARETFPDEDLYRFGLQIIDGNGDVLQEMEPFPERVTSSEFFQRRIGTFVVEYVFRRPAFVKNGGFISFDMAWGADHATWTALSKDKGMVSITNAKVYWRRSDLNISGKKDGVETSRRKILADLAFVEWSYGFFARQGMSYPLSPWADAYRYSVLLSLYQPMIFPTEMFGYLIRYARISGNFLQYPLCAAYVLMKYALTAIRRW